MRLPLLITGAVLSLCASLAQTAQLRLWGTFGEHDLAYNAALDRHILRTSMTPSDQPYFLQFYVDSPGTSSLLMFSTERLGIPLAPGTYLDAQRAPGESPGHPGLMVTFQASGCNSVTGNFTVNQLEYSREIGIQRFSVSFEQHCEGGEAAGFGTFDYQAIPEPGTTCLFLSGAVLLLVSRCRGNPRRPR